MKLWGGRFQKSTDKKVDDFNSSIRFDARMYKQDIMGSIAHAKMLGKQKIISSEDFPSTNRKSFAISVANSLLPTEL